MGMGMGMGKYNNSNIYANGSSLFNIINTLTNLMCKVVLGLYHRVWEENSWS